jgi:predicted small secreted protein
MRWLSFLLIFSFFLSSCETIKGVGRDIESAGEAIEEAID